MVFFKNSQVAIGALSRATKPISSESGHMLPGNWGLAWQRQDTLPFPPPSFFPSLQEINMSDLMLVMGD